MRGDLIQIRPFWDAHNNGQDVNRWSIIHPRFQDHDGCIVDLGCFGWNRDFNNASSDNWAGYFFGKKRLIGVDPQESPNAHSELFSGFISNFTGKANLINDGIQGKICPDPNGIYNVLTWKEFKHQFNINSVSILKVNIEGSEIDVIPSLNTEDFKSIDQIAISFHDWLYPDIHSKVQECINHITAHNYEDIDLGIYGWHLFLKKY